MRLLVYKMKVIFEEPLFQVDSFYLFLAKKSYPSTKVRRIWLFFKLSSTPYSQVTSAFGLMYSDRNICILARSSIVIIMTIDKEGT